MFGYVITNNHTDTAAGFWSPFPRLVVMLGDLRTKHWDYWSVRSELAYRKDQRTVYPR